MLNEKADVSESSTGETKYKVSQALLDEFVGTYKANDYNISDADMLDLFKDELGGDLNKLKVFKEYAGTYTDPQFKTVEAVNAEFPEFDFSGDGAPKSKAGLGKVVGGTPNLVNKKKPVVNNKFIRPFANVSGSISPPYTLSE